MCLCHSPRIDRRTMLSLLGNALAAPMLAGCDEGDGFPIHLVSDETVRRMGLESWQRIREKTPVSHNRELTQVLHKVGSRLLTATGEPPERWEMVVFASPEVNAFALPGGKIGVFEGMFRVVANADQLAAVVGHEIGHNQAEHSHERLSAAAAKQLGLKLVSVALQLGDIRYANEIAALLGVGVEFGLELPYSRRQELEADRLGLFTMAKARFDPRQAVDLWRRMDRIAAQRVPAFLSTHPAPEARIAAIEKLLPEVAQVAQRG
jgi:predicted Zn-dependent protease